MSEEDYRNEFWDKLEYKTPDELLSGSNKKESRYKLLYTFVLGLFFGVLLNPIADFLITLYNRY